MRAWDSTHMKTDQSATKYKRYDAVFKHSAVEHWMFSGKSASNVRTASLCSLHGDTKKFLFMAVFAFCLILFVQSAKCEQMEYSGTATKRVFDRVSADKVIDEEQTSFKVIAGESTWKIVLHMIGTPDGTYAELFFDGMDIFAMARGAGGEVLAGRQAGKFESTGTVYRGPVPLGSEHVQGIWLALCSEKARTNWPTRFPNLFDAGNYVADTYVPATISFSSNDLVMSVQIWKERNNQKYLAEDFVASEVGVYLGKSYIKKYVRHVYGRSSDSKSLPILSWNILAL